jgi:splicing factor 45
MEETLTTSDQQQDKEIEERLPRDLGSKLLGSAMKGNSVAAAIMKKYGYKEGQGLGRQEQGISTALSVEKTGQRQGKIINQHLEKQKTAAGIEDVPPEMLEPVREQVDSNITELMRNPTKVVLLMNMVGPGEVDDELQPETAEECSKYGEVAKVIIYEVWCPSGCWIGGLVIQC